MAFTPVVSIAQRHGKFNCIEAIALFPQRLTSLKMTAGCITVAANKENGDDPAY
jgi:hypothetical protein